MPGILTTLPNIGKSASKYLSASLNEEKRKLEAIAELKREFLGKRFSEFLAENLARERYLLIHKNQNNDTGRI